MRYTYVALLLLSLILLQHCGPSGDELISKARSHMHNGDFADAVVLLDEVIRRDSKNQAAYNMRGIAKLELGQTDYAISDFDISVTLDSSDYRSFYNRGNAYYRNEDFNRAILDYDAGLRMQPKEADIYINRGNALVQLDRYREAIHDYSFALKLDSKSYLTHFNLARAYYLMDSLDLAKTSFEKSLEIYDTFAPAYYFLGMIAIEMRQLDTSCQLLERASGLGYAQANEVRKVYCNRN